MAQYPLTIVSIDIYAFSLKGCPPAYSRLQDAQDSLASGKFVPDAHAIEMAKIIGPSLTVLADLNNKLYELYLEACHVTVALDQYNRGTRGRPNLQDLLAARNRIQHSFCSVPPVPNVESDIRVALSETCRIAGLIFADMVILPLPYNSGVKPRLARQLRMVLESPSAKTCWSSPEYGGLVMWVVLIGSIAATLTEDRSWFLGQLRLLVDDQKLDWYGFRELMRTFLWWDFAFEVPAGRIWTEMYAPE